jgi:hypothetical protein
MGLRHMPEAGAGGAQKMWISAAGAARSEADCVGARTGIDGGMSEIADDGGEY